jgi:hypothetical protein
MLTLERLSFYTFSGSAFSCRRDGKLVIFDTGRSQCGQSELGQSRASPDSHKPVTSEHGETTEYGRSKMIESYSEQDLLTGKCPQVPPKWLSDTVNEWCVSAVMCLELSITPKEIYDIWHEDAQWGRIDPTSSGLRVTANHMELAPRMMYVVVLHFGGGCWAYSSRSSWFCSLANDLSSIAIASRGLCEVPRIEWRRMVSYSATDLILYGTLGLARSYLHRDLACFASVGDDGNGASITHQLPSLGHYLTH